MKPLTRGDTWLREAVNNDWGAKVPAGIRPEELDAHPSFFNILGGEVRPLDTIWLEAADRTWVARFVFLRCDVGYVFARLMPGTVFEIPRLVGAGSPKPIPEGWDIVPTEPGEGQGFMHLRKSDGRRFPNSGGGPFANWQEAYEELLKRPIFSNTAGSPRYYPR